MIEHSPLNTVGGAKLGTRNEPHGAGSEVRGVVHRIVKLDHLQRVDERASAGVVRVHAEAETHVPAARAEDGLVVGGAAGEDVVGGVDGGPEGAVHDEVEDGRRRRGGPVEEGGAEQVAAVAVDGELVAELLPGLVREVTAGGERRVEEALVGELVGLAAGDVAAIGEPLEAAAVGGGRRGAAVEQVVVAAEWRLGGGGEGEERGEEGEVEAHLVGGVLFFFFLARLISGGNGGGNAVFSRCAGVVDSGSAGAGRRRWARSRAREGLRMDAVGGVSRERVRLGQLGMVTRRGFAGAFRWCCNRTGSTRPNSPGEVCRSDARYLQPPSTGDRPRWSHLKDGLNNYTNRHCRRHSLLPPPPDRYISVVVKTKRCKNDWGMMLLL